MIKDVWWSGFVWVGECFFWYWPTLVVPDQRLLNGCVYVRVCVCVCVWGFTCHSTQNRSFRRRSSVSLCVFLCVCWSRLWALQKWLSRSRCRLGCGLLALGGSLDPPWEGLFRGGGLYLGIPKLACGQPNYEHCTECQARSELEDFVGAEFYYSWWQLAHSDKEVLDFSSVMVSMLPVFRFTFILDWKSTVTYWRMFIICN